VPLDPNPKSKGKLALVLLIATACVATGVVWLASEREPALPPPAKPEIPVRIAWRETKLPGNTQIARITPRADAPLPLRVSVEITVQATGARKTDEWILERSHLKEPKEIGLLEGHRFVPGDTITIRHQDYTPLTATCQASP
jgi:hypothetical protein